MANVTRDYCGLLCPIPILKVKLMITKKEVVAGDMLEFTADCPTLAADVKQFCQETGKVMISLLDMGGGKKKVKIQI